MRTETITRTIYTWEELTEEQKQKVLEKLWDLNVDYDWWQSTYEDAATIGLQITGFDIDRGSYCSGELTVPAQEVIKNILKNHGENCDTFKLAKEWENTSFYLPAEDNEDPEEDTDKIEEFTYALREEYLSILRREYEYLTSEEAIVDSIQAKNYEFYEDGSLI